ncbi:MAG: hypothetical protein HPY61_03365 [Methanotrichaceae archaeon]|nr:hypothetical protein [Methanotrichaceae archaeon]
MDSLVASGSENSSKIDKMQMVGNGKGGYPLPTLLYQSIIIRALNTGAQDQDSL